MTDLITAACELGMLSTSALTIWATWSRSVALDRLRKANERADRAIACAERGQKWEERAMAYIIAEPARIEAAIKEHRRAHLKRISVLGNKSDKRRKREG